MHALPRFNIYYFGVLKLTRESQICTSLPTFNDVILADWIGCGGIIYTTVISKCYKWLFFPLESLLLYIYQYNLRYHSIDIDNM